MVDFEQYTAAQIWICSKLLADAMHGRCLTLRQCGGEARHPFLLAEPAQQSMTNAYDGGCA